LWTSELVAELIERECGLRYHPGHVWKILVTLGWSCQRPTGRARERNEPHIRRWKPPRAVTHKTKEVYRSIDVYCNVL
jgi:transposase